MTKENENELYAPPESDVETITAADEVIMHNRAQLSKFSRVWHWIFVGLGGFSLVIGVAQLFGIVGSVNFFGIEIDSLGPVWSILTTLMHVLMGLAAYGLVTGKPWGLRACKLTAIAVLAVILIDTVLRLYFSGALYINLMIIAPILYYLFVNGHSEFWRTR